MGRGDRGGRFVTAALIGFQVWFCLQLLSQKRARACPAHGLEAAVRRGCRGRVSVPSSGSGTARSRAGRWRLVRRRPVARRVTAPGRRRRRVFARGAALGERPLICVSSPTRGRGRWTPLIHTLPARRTSTRPARDFLRLDRVGDQERNVAKAAEHGSSRCWSRHGRSRRVLRRQRHPMPVVDRPRQRIRARPSPAPKRSASSRCPGDGSGDRGHARCPRQWPSPRR